MAASCFLATNDSSNCVDSKTKLIGLSNIMRHMSFTHKNKRSRLLGILIIVLIFASRIVSATITKLGQNVDSAITHDGIERTFRLYIPASHDKKKPAPLLMILHGGGGTGKRMANLARGGFKSIADEEGFIIVYPDGIERHWNDGRIEVTYQAHAEKIDDVGFLTTLMDHLVNTYNLDPERVYVCGVSNGAMMTQRLAFEASGKIAAIAPVIGSIPVALA